MILLITFMLGGFCGITLIALLMANGEDDEHNS